MSSSSKKPLEVGGKLKFKGSSSTAASSSRNQTKDNVLEATAGMKRSLEASSSSDKSGSNLESKTSEEVVSSAASSIHLTEAQKRFKEKQRQLEESRLKKIAAKPFRERVEELNATLSKLTEHNDIPRVSAAGNG